jgi:glycosyltransferase involved in cell wall biosynthesis
MPVSEQTPRGPAEPLAGRRILLVVNKDWYFLSHRLPLAVSLRDAGAQVTIAAGATGRETEIMRHGFQFRPLTFDRGGINPFRELRTIADLYRVIRIEKPEIVHNIAIKATLYGSIAARLAGVKAIVNTVTGLGFLFTATTGFGAALRWLVSPFFRLACRAKKVHFIFFNDDDRETFFQLGFTTEAASTVIPGSGVEIESFPPADPSREPPTIVMCARLLLDKGLRELVAATRLLRSEGLTFRVIVAGERDSSNPHVVDAQELAGWIAEGLIEAPGFIKDTRALLSSASIAALPSYREGMPLFLLEALAAGLPIVTTDVPGCRATVEPGVNGERVPARNAIALAAALRSLITDPTRRAQLGASSRRIARERFAQDIVNAQTLRVYENSCLRGSLAQRA